MKKLILIAVICSSSLSLLTGCVASVGGGGKTITQEPTKGQQLIDLQRAKDSGALTDSEYQAQKAQVLNGR